ncbi:hypothetical protein FIBSPDRAFT_1039069 [Athelia psychrophila]|uniref:Uncharacterized protein n=1 Tax=Athelia psychrophila TaxID=1759441 RepID=A0A166S647_9AGAM|nr:hypothetical protein FIBSPDRAFT_1039069 [Fibularhizoctonia sp. CBS 109695]
MIVDTHQSCIRLVVRQIAIPQQTSYHKYGGYPQVTRSISFLKKIIKVTNEAILRSGPTKHIPAVQEFKNAAEGDAAVVSDINIVPNFETLLSLLDRTLSEGPPFHID